MKFVPAKCPTCQGDLQIPDDRDIVKCMYCGVEIKVRDVIYLVNSHQGDIPFWFNDARKNFELAKNNKSQYSEELWNFFLNQSVKIYDNIIIADNSNWEAYFEKGIVLSNLTIDKIIPCYVNSNEENSRAYLQLHLPHYYRFLQKYKIEREKNNIIDSQFNIFYKCISLNQILTDNLIMSKGYGDTFDYDMSKDINHDIISAFEKEKEFILIDKYPSLFNEMKKTFLSAINYSNDLNKKRVTYEFYKILENLIEKYQEINTDIWTIPQSHRNDLTLESFYIVNNYERLIYFVRSLIYLLEVCLELKVDNVNSTGIKSDIKEMLDNILNMDIYIRVCKQKFLSKEEKNIQIQLKIYEPYLSIFKSLKEKYDNNSL